MKKSGSIVVAYLYLKKSDCFQLIQERNCLSVDEQVVSFDCLIPLEIKTLLPLHFCLGRKILFDYYSREY